MTINELFELDDLRTKLIRGNNTKKLKSTYLIKTFTTNLNTISLWEEKILSTIGKNPMKDHRIKTAANWLNRKSKKVLDIGVGDGELEKMICRERKDVKIFGVDITQKGLKQALTKSNFTPIIASIHQLPFKNKFDTIYLLEVLEHFEYFHTFKILKEIKKSLNRKGEFILSVPINEKYSSGFNPNQHMRRYSELLIIKELELAGFKISQTQTFYAFHNNYKLKNLIAKVVKTKWSPNAILIKATK